MTIFAIDDEALPLDILVKAIKKAVPEAEIMSFANSSDALRAAENTKCDIAFVDIEMPEMNGMELAKRMKLGNPKINIIFATGYPHYALEAVGLFISGYLIKPITPEKVLEQIENLRHPIEQRNEKRVRIQTFGNFEVYIDNKPVEFERSKTKEFLAYLVDRGTVCTNAQVSAALWDTDVKDAYIRHLRKDLSDTFKAAGCKDVLLFGRGRQGIDRDKVDCDYYDWQKGIPSAINNYRGEYMVQYSWAEFTKGSLD